ncbi:MAG TPA: hypothetical protein PLE10_10085 [Brevefilum sp.]|nr:hypothetical protein [Brevefilum sp.]HOR20157.1 hypothetical protein [Brevefilum sp.]HPL69150.1 hypothetical protein [Brevefilum sp.]
MAIISAKTALSMLVGSAGLDETDLDRVDCPGWICSQKQGEVCRFPDRQLSLFCGGAHRPALQVYSNNCYESKWWHTDEET